MNKGLVILVTLIFGMSGCSESSNDGKLAAETLSKKQTDGLEFLLDPSALWYKVRLGPWECAVPEKNPDATLLCTKGHGVVVMASDEPEGFSISVPLSKKNHAAILTLTDQDKDEIFDRLSFDGISKEGEALKTVIDDDLDGNVDRVIDFKKKKTSVRIGNEWIELESGGRDDKGLVIYKGNINGSMKRVIFSSYPYQVTDLPEQVNNANQSKQ